MNNELIQTIMKDTMDIQNNRIITKDTEIARLMDQVANLKSENVDLRKQTLKSKEDYRLWVQ
jgi:hypothetical protein